MGNLSFWDWTRAPFFFFFFNDTATTEIYTLSLHDALPIFRAREHCWRRPCSYCLCSRQSPDHERSEEYTSELQSRFDLVCRLLLEKKNREGRASLHERKICDDNTRAQRRSLD